MSLSTSIGPVEGVQFMFVVPPSNLSMSTTTLCLFRWLRPENVHSGTLHTVIDRLPKAI
jgi:hypothetical protein